MSHPEKFNVDKWMIRAKDIIIIVAALLSFMGYGLKLYKIPGVQEAQAVLIKEQGLKLITHDQDIAVLKSGINDIKTLILSKSA